MAVIFEGLHVSIEKQVCVWGGGGGGRGESGRTRLLAMRQQTMDKRMRTCLEQMLTLLAQKEETKGITPSQRKKKKKKKRERKKVSFISIS